MKRLVILFLFVCTISPFLQAQGDDPVLFEVADIPVHVSEFKYIYEKTNGNDATYSRQSLQEYLELYKKFKLKVKKAQDMRLDTIPSLKTELEGYRRQLSNSYLIDKEVTESLMKEAYDRSKTDVDISHIMIALKPDPTPADTLVAYQKIMQIYTQLEKGQKFVTMAKSGSDDTTAKDNGGRIGFINAMVPNGFYNMETAAYTTPKGQFSKPVRTRAGYHIIKVNDTRTARGEVEVAHILIRKGKDNKYATQAKITIDSVYAALKGGADFGTLAKNLSQDKQSASKGGNIGMFGINRYEKAFEDTAFGLSKDGDYSGPIETQVGWHVIKRIKKRPEEPYKVKKGRLQSAIKRDARHEIAKDAMIDNIKNAAKYKQYDKTLDKYISNLDASFTTYKWKPSEDAVPKALFTLGKNNYTIIDFEKYLAEAARVRMRLGRSGDVTNTAKTLFGDFVRKTSLEYEESQLEVKYPEFKSLMREYEEGILLFEATKMLVWDKASQDSLGLEQFFEKVKDAKKYMWKERATVSFVKVKPEFAKSTDKIRALAAKSPTKDILNKYNKKEVMVTTRTETYEKGKNEVLDAMKWQVNELSATEISKKDGSHNFLKVEQILPPASKSLNEARGYVVADYQDYLEKDWVQRLEQEYEVKINEKVFKKLIK